MSHLESTRSTPPRMPRARSATLLLLLNGGHVCAWTSSATSLVLRRHHRPVMTSAETAENEWSALDSWLQGGGREEVPAVRRALPERTVVSGDGRRIPFFDALSFSQLGTSEAVNAGLGRCGFEQPSVVQAAAFGPIKRGEDVIISHPPGSGKSLAYALPLVQRLLEVDAAEGPTPEGRVRAIVLVPSSELAKQTLHLLRGIANRKLRISVATSGNKWQTQRERTADGLEILIATFGRLSAHLREGSFSLSEVRQLVIDEADMVYQDSRLRSVWTNLRAELPPAAAVVLASSTWPNRVAQEESPLSLPTYS